MARSRRRFLAQAARGAAVAAVAPAVAAAASATEGSERPRGPYDHLGRTPGYRDWAIVARGLTVKSIETFQRD